MIHEKYLFKRNEKNVAYEVTSTQLPAMIGGAFVDLFMTKGHMREPHWHPNAWELDVVVSGEAVTSILNPETNQLQNYHVKGANCLYSNGMVALDHSGNRRSAITFVL